MARTRSSNSDSHPGLPDVPPRRRKTGEVQADNASKAAAKQREEQATKEKEDKLAQLELLIKENEELTRKLREEHSKQKDSPKKPQGKCAACMKPKRKRKAKSKGTDDESDANAMEIEAPTPAPKSRKSRGADADGAKAAATEDDEEEEEESEPIKKKKKTAKDSLRASVEASKAKFLRGRVDESAANSDSALSADTATSKGQSRVRHWAAGVTATAPSSSSSTAFPRTLAIPATPYTGNQKPSGATKPKGKAAESKGKAAEPKGRTVQPMPDVKVKSEPLDEPERGFVGTDDEAEEAEAAKNSPAKNGARLSSAALVQCDIVDLTTPGKTTEKKVPRNDKSAKGGRSIPGSSRSSAIALDEDSADAPPTAKPPRSAGATNKDLPAVAVANNRWKHVFLPTLFAWLGSLNNPWPTSDVVTVPVLRRIWCAVYGEDSGYTIKDTNDPVYCLVNQRIYEWRGAFGHGALRAFEVFFGLNPKKYASHEARSEFCRTILVSKRIFFADLDPNSDDNSGLYQSPFVLGPLSVHMEAIDGAIEVPGLFSRRTGRYPWGAIGLAAAAAFRAAMLWLMGKVGYDKEGRPIAAKTFNPATGKDSSKDTEFSITKYEARTLQFVSSAKTLAIESVDQIIQAALERSDVPVASTAPAEDPLRMILDFDYSQLTEN